MDSLVPQIVENFKAAYGLKITDSADLFLSGTKSLGVSHEAWPCGDGHCLPEHGQRL